MASTIDQLGDGLARFGRLLVPEVQDRKIVSWASAPYTMMFFIPLLFMAYLSRRPNTYYIRLLMLPTVIVTSIHCCWAYRWPSPSLNNYNWGMGLMSLVSTAKALDFISEPDGLFKIGERKPGDIQTPAISKKDYDPKDPTHIANGHTPVTGLHRPGSSFVPLWLQDALEIMFACRGIGWEWGKGVYVPPEIKPFDRKGFILATVNSFCLNFLLLDVLESLVKLVPGVGTPTGGTIFLQHLDPLKRYLLSTAIHFATGFALLGGFRMVYDLSTLVGVGILHHDPTSWPPIIDRPWASANLHEFWAKRWHQLLRRTFLVFGGIPGRRLGGTGGMVIGTFVASGVYHELSSMAIGRGFDWRVLGFFAMQSVFVILERIWRIVTGHRVGGWQGIVWVYFVIGILGQPLVDAWHQKGLGGGTIIPPVLSPTRQFIFPFISRITGWDISLYYL